MRPTPDELAEQFLRKIADLNLRASQAAEYMSAEIAARDASAVEVERQFAEAIAAWEADDAITFVEEDMGTDHYMCMWCRATAERKQDIRHRKAGVSGRKDRVCPKAAFDAALARVASLKGGTNHG